jgi:uncharacterized protein
MMPLIQTEPRMAITLPDGFVIQAEIAATERERKQGLKFRPKLDPDEGMLFVFKPQPSRIPSFHRMTMWQVRIPLDIVWMDSSGQIVEVARNLPANVNWVYGGRWPSSYALEMPAGTIDRCGVQVGQTLQLGRVSNG